jgi:hypothetical protein
MIGMIIAAGISAAAASRQADKQSDKQHDQSLEMLNRRYELDREDRAAQRQYQTDALNAWSAYGMGGAQGGMWNAPQQGLGGLLSPNNFRQQQGYQPVQMPWGNQQGGFYGRR